MTLAATTPAQPSPVERVKHRLEELPLRVRLVAVLMVLLLAALMLTAGATVALMRRDLLGRIDSDLQSAAQPVATQAVTSLVRGSNNAQLPSNYAFVLMLPDVEQPITVRSSTTPVLPSVDTLTPTDPRVRYGRPFTIGSVDSPLKWRAVAGTVGSGPRAATFVVAGTITFFS